MAATLPPPRLLPSGDSAITVEFSRTIDDAANERVLALDKALAARRSRASPRPCRPIARCWCITIPARSALTRSARSCSRLASQPLPPVDQGAALAHSRRLWRRARHRSRGCRQSAEHHARRHRRPACRRRLPRRHDRLHAGLVLSERPRQIPAHAAAAEPAAVHAGRHDLDRRHAGRDPVPGRARAAGTCSAARRCGPISCTANPTFLTEPGDRVTFFAIDHKTFEEQDRAAEAGEIIAEQVAA